MSDEAPQLDPGLYAEILWEHSVESGDTAGTRVDYRALRESAAWGELLAGLARSRPGDLAPGPPSLAFWINAYNVLAIAMVLEHYPVESIRDGGNLLWPVWKRPAGVVGGESLSLDHVEHRILRRLGEPRIHAAIVCASTSCPSLAREPYRAEALHPQLDAACRRWLASETKGLAIEPDRGRVWLSRIFHWFAGDFGGVEGVRDFVARHAPEPARAWLEGEGRRARIRHLDYDWSLNDVLRS